MMGENDGVSLPPGFHFHPTDEELILHFLYPRSFLSPPHHQIIPDLNYLSHPPWELHGKALASGKEWYFFSSPVRGNMETGNGFWKNSESEEPIFTSAGIQVGIRALHVFCIGRAPTGVETNWVMHEYHLCNRDGLSSGNSDGASHSRRRRRRSQNTERNRWVLCRVYEDDNRNCRRGSRHDCGGENNDGCSVELSCLDEIFLSLDDDFDEVCLPNQ